MMKKLTLLALMVMFMASTIVVPAWAKPCLSHTDMVVTQGVSVPTNDDMPCHEGTQGKSQHCEGLCLCLHASSVSKTPIVEATAILMAPNRAKNTIMAKQDLFISQTTAPLRRPPKPISL